LKGEKIKVCFATSAEIKHGITTREDLGLYLVKCYKEGMIVIGILASAEKLNLWL
jgi:hypothetical protein